MGFFGKCVNKCSMVCAFSHQWQLNFGCVSNRVFRGGRPWLDVLFIRCLKRFTWACRGVTTSGALSCDEHQCSMFPVRLHGAGCDTGGDTVAFTL